MSDGIYSNPEWYAASDSCKGLTAGTSTMDEWHQYMYCTSSENEGALQCPDPPCDGACCDINAGECPDSCSGAINWGKSDGIYSNPEWYAATDKCPGLTAGTSTMDEWHEFMYCTASADDTGVVCPIPPCDQTPPPTPLQTPPPTPYEGDDDDNNGCRTFVADCYRAEDCDGRWSMLEGEEDLCGYDHGWGHSDCDNLDTTAIINKCDDDDASPPPTPLQTPPPTPYEGDDDDHHGDDDDAPPPPPRCSHKEKASLNGFLISPVASMAEGEVQSVACPKNILGSVLLLCEGGKVSLAKTSTGRYCIDHMDDDNVGVCDKFGQACGFPPSPAPGVCEDTSSDETCEKIMKKMKKQENQCTESQGKKCKRTCELC